MRNAPDHGCRPRNITAHPAIYESEQTETFTIVMLQSLPPITTRVQNAVCDRWIRCVRAAGRGSKPLLFEHVPKSAGTTVIQYLRRHYPARRIFTIDGMRPDASHDEFRSMEAPKRYSYDLVYGHGAHKLMGLVRPDMIRATILRNPVDRLVSHYFFVKASPAHYLHEAVMTKRMSLTDYVQSDLSAELRNNLVRRFSGIPWQEADRDPDAAVETTLQILLNNYQIVGFTEDLDKSMQEFARVLQFGSSWQGKSHNITRNKPRLAEISKEDLDLVRRFNALDVEVYQQIRKAVLAETPSDF